MRNAAIVIIALLVLAGGWYYFSSLRPGTPAPQTNDMSGMQQSGSLPSGSMETGTVDTSNGTPAEDDFTVSGFNFGFSPNNLTARKGDHVKITFTNTGGMHDFKIDEFAVATPRIDTGQTAVVEFDATKAGTFQFYCSVGNHRAMGMWGTLTVTE